MVELHRVGIYSLITKTGYYDNSYDIVFWLEKKDNILGLIIFILAGGLLFAHRRVIKAFFTGEPMPKAPAWHCWVRKEARKSN